MVSLIGQLVNPYKISVCKTLATNENEEIYMHIQVAAPRGGVVEYILIDCQVKVLIGPGPAPVPLLL